MLLVVGGGGRRPSPPPHPGEWDTLRDLKLVFRLFGILHFRDSKERGGASASYR